jgi:hypothetical protein
MADHESAGAEVGGKRFASDIEGGTEYDSLAKQQALEIPADPNLPAPWQAHVSTRTGKPYWYNPDTKETTWIYPAQKRQGAPASPNGAPEDLPSRPGDVKCKHYLRFGTCKYGHTCKFDHPPDEKGNEVEFPPELRPLPTRTPFTSVPFAQFDKPSLGAAGYPIRPGEQECSFFAKTGKCKYSDTCRWNHSADKQIQSVQEGIVWQPERNPKRESDSGGGMMGGGMQGMMGGGMQGMMGMPGMGANEWEMHMSDDGRPYYYNSRTQESTWEPPPAMMMNMMAGMMGGSMMGGSQGAVTGGSVGGMSGGHVRHVGLAGGLHPIRPGAEKCSYYMKTGGCKFGETCKFDHPPEMLGIGTPMTSTPGLPPRSESGYQKVEIRQERSVMIVGDSRQTGPSSTTAEGYPVRPGMPDCAFYMKSGICKFGPTCKYNHPHKGLSGLPDASGMSSQPFYAGMMGM